MKKSLKVVLVIIVGVVLIGCFGDNKKSSSQPIVSKNKTTADRVSEAEESAKESFQVGMEMGRELAIALKRTDCAEFIECLSAKTIAEEYGRTERWAVANYKVSVWSETAESGKGTKVGEMRCGSRAIVLNRSGDDYKILSPLDNSIGWVNKVQTAKTLFQNPNTYEKCVYENLNRD